MRSQARDCRLEQSANLQGAHPVTGDSYIGVGMRCSLDGQEGNAHIGHVPIKHVPV